MSRPESLTFVRFVIADRDDQSGRRQGLFQAAAHLRKQGGFDGQSESEHDAIREWFNRNLESPKRLAVSPRPHSKAQAISWFKSSALVHISKMRELGELLQRHDLHVEMIRTVRPGYVLYEDEFQVAAYPYADTPS